MWFSLRVGLANTAVIAVLAMLPLVTMAMSLLENGTELRGIDRTFAVESQVAWRANPLPLNSPIED